jgi:hypothetical protein
MSSNPDDIDTHADFGAIRVPGSRPHNRRYDRWGSYPKGWKGIITASIAKRTVFRTGWANTIISPEEVDSEMLFPMGHRQPHAEDIRVVDIK